MNYYAGIGTRKTTIREEQSISIVAQELARRGYGVYSGHADGADITFEHNSSSGVIWMPWNSFNSEQPRNDKLIYEVLNTQVSLESVEEFHPAPYALSQGVKKKNQNLRS